MGGIVKLETPMKSIRGNLLYTKSGQCWAYYLITPKYLHIGNQDKIEAHKKSMFLLFDRLAKFTDIHLQMFPSEMRIEERFEDLEQDYDPSMKAIGHYYNQRAINILKDELKTVTEYSFILGLRVKNNLITADTTVKDSVGTSFSNVTNSLLNWLGYDREVDEKEYELFSDSEKEASQYLANIGGKPISEDMLFYINRYNFIRGLKHSYNEEISDKHINISDTVLDSASEVGYIKIISENDESYVAMLPISKTADDLRYVELFTIAQSFSFPVEFQMKLKKRNKAQLQRKIGNTSRRYKETDKDMYSNQDSDDEILDGLDKLNYLRNQVSNKNVPFYDWLACFVVTGETKQQCFDRAQIVKDKMENHYCKCVQPQADQLNLFYKFLHGKPLNVIETNWLQSSTHEAISEFQFGVSQRLGNNVGQYIGRITNGIFDNINQAIYSSRFLVLIHFFLANEGIEGAVTDSPHIAITGQTGKGKSVLAKAIFFYVSFLKGQVLMTDPKSEVKLWFDKALNDPQINEYYPQFIELIQQIRYVTLDPTDPKNLGVLDPLLFLEETQAKDSILTMFEQVFPKRSLRVENEIRKNLETLFHKRSKGEKVGLMQLVDQMEQNQDEEISQVGEYMRRTIKGSILQLAFSDGTTETLNVNNKMTILQIQGLELPDQDLTLDDMTEQDKMHLALMIPLAKFCQYFGMRDKESNTTVIFDEAWTLTKGRGGKRLVKELRRVGRSFKNQLVMVTQSVDDIQNADDTGNFGMCFSFDESSERDKILAHMNLEQTEYNREVLENMKKGQCIYKDIYGNVGQLSIDIPFNEWLKAFKTVNKSHSAKAERKYDQ